MLTEDMMKKVDEAALVMQKAREYINDLQAGIAMSETTNRELSARVRELEAVNAEQYKQIKELETTISKMETPGWVSVKDRLPETNLEVLIWIDGIGVQQADFYVEDKGFYVEDYKYPSYWMPLPQPPKEGK